MLHAEAGPVVAGGFPDNGGGGGGGGVSTACGRCRRESCVGREAIKYIVEYDKIKKTNMLSSGRNC